MRPELGRRIAFTLGALLVYRLGSHIPLPGIDIAVWAKIEGAGRGGSLALVTALSGGPLHRIAILSIGILPYISAAILIQFAMMFWSRLRAISQQGDHGRKKIVAYTRYLTLVMTAFQALAIAQGLENVPGVVVDPGSLFELSTMLTLTAGTMFLIWLADQITARGIGNGIALILSAGIVAQLPSIIASTGLSWQERTLPTELIFGTTVLAAGAVALIVFVEGARRRIWIDFPKREIGDRAIEGVSKSLALKLNNAGLMPMIFDSWFLFLPITVASFGLWPDSTVATAILKQLSFGRPLFLVLHCALIVVFALFYTAFLLDPEKSSETLKMHGGAIRGIEPGEPSAAYIDHVVSRIAIVGGLYLGLVIMILPYLLISYFAVPFYIGGVSFLVVVCTIMDIEAQYKQQMQLQPGGYSR